MDRSASLLLGLITVLCCLGFGLTDAVEETKPTESAQQEEVKEEESKADQENA